MRTLLAALPLIVISACGLVPASADDVPFEPAPGQCAGVSTGSACGTGAQADVLYTCKDEAIDGDGVRCASTQVCRGAAGAAECITNPCAALVGGDGKVCGAGKFDQTLYTCTNGAPDLAEEKTCGSDEACRLANGAGTALCTANPCAGIVSGHACGFGGNANSLYTCEAGVSVGAAQACGSAARCEAGATADDASCAKLPDWELLPPVEDSFLVSIAWYRNTLYVASNVGHIFYLQGDAWVRDAAFEAALGTDCCTGASYLLSLQYNNEDRHLYAAGQKGRVMHLDPTGVWTKHSTGSTANAWKVTGNISTGSPWLVIVGNGGYFTNNVDGDPFTFTTGGLSIDGSLVTTNLAAYAGGLTANVVVGALHFAAHSAGGGPWIRDTVQAGATADFEDVIASGTAGAAAVDGAGNLVEVTFENPSAPATWAVTKTFPVRARAITRTAGNKLFVVGSSGFATYRDGSTWYETTTGITGDLRRVLTLNGVIYAVGGGNGVGTVLKYAPR